jgi:hypothetical protein
MTVTAVIRPPAADSFALVCAFNKISRAGFTLTVRADHLMVDPADQLLDAQRNWIRARKPELLALLFDTDRLNNTLIDASAAGLGWREGTPPDWSDDRLLAAGEVLYGDGRMVNRNERRYARQGALRTEPDGGTTPSKPAGWPAPTIAEASGPDTNPFAVRASEVQP